MVRSVIRIPPWLACPAKTVNTLAPRAAIRSCTAFWAPLPNATMVITAPTPMMMPSMVSTDRSMLARIDCSATATVSPSSMLAPRSAGSGLTALLLHAGNGSPASCPGETLPHILLGLDQAGAGKNQDGIGGRQPLQDLAVVHVGQSGADPHRLGAAIA